MRNVQDSVQEQFGPVAAAYVTSAVHAGGPDLEAMVAAGNLQGTERVLDVATGAGHTAIAFARQAAEVTAFDLTEAMLATAQNLAAEQGVTNISVRCGGRGAPALPGRQLRPRDLPLRGPSLPAPGPGGKGVGAGLEARRPPAAGRYRLPG